jgi:hypothetical protein
MVPPKGEIVDTAASGLPPAATAALASRSRTERATS